MIGHTRVGQTTRQGDTHQGNHRATCTSRQDTRRNRTDKKTLENRSWKTVSKHRGLDEKLNHRIEHYNIIFILQ